MCILMRQYYNQVNEQELIQLLCARDEPAFRHLVDTYKSKVYATVYNMLQDRDDAEDSAQEVFIQVYESISSFKGQSSLSTWIYRIAVRKALDKLRRRKTRRKLQQFLPWWMPKDDDKCTPDDTIPLESKERIAMLHKAMETLPEKQKIALTLIKIQGISYNETCKIMELGIKAIESLVSRGKDNLEKRLKELL